MKNPFAKKADLRTRIDQEIERLGVKAETLDEMTEVYKKQLELDELASAKAGAKKGVSADTLAVVLGNLAGILLILKHEELHVVASKAVGFVLRGRV